MKRSTKHQLKLTLGWKVELAKRVKQSLLQRGPEAVEEATRELWGQLFDTLTG
jgi:hypothetical protein